MLKKEKDIQVVLDGNNLPSEIVIDGKRSKVSEIFIQEAFSRQERGYSSSRTQTYVYKYKARIWANNELTTRILFYYMENDKWMIKV